MRIRHLPRQRRVQILGGCAIVMVVLTVAVVTEGDGGREQVVAIDERTTSSSPKKASRRSAATEKAGDPSSTATSSANPKGSKEPGSKATGTKEGRGTGRSGKEGSGKGGSGTSGKPASAAPSTTPPTAPTSTTPPPPPPPPGDNLDRMAVLAWAKANRGDSAPPAYSDPSCGESVGQDAIGDDADGDLTTVSLARDCLGTYRASVPDGQASGRWIEIDAQAGGCDAVDVMAFVWSTGSSILGAVVATPSCDPASWSSPGSAGDPDGGLIDFAGSTFGDPTTFGWRAGMLGSAEDTQIDLLPDAGFITFQR